MAAELLGDRLGPGAAAVEDPHIVGAGIDEVAQRFPAHFAGTHQHHRFTGQRLKELGGNCSDSHARHADAFAVDRRLLLHPFGDAAGSLKGGMCQRAGRAPGARQVIRFLDLRKDLGLTDHHAVQTRRNGEQMRDRLGTAAVNHRVDQLVDRELALLGQKLQHLRVGWTAIEVLPRRRSRSGGVELDTIAGAQQHQLASRKLLAKGQDRLLRLVAGERELFTKINSRCLVAATNHLQLHDASPTTASGRIGTITTSLLPTGCTTKVLVTAAVCRPCSLDNTPYNASTRKPKLASVR